ncbi:sporulation protein [Streptomyces sp. NPDC006551]|uniref:sporulation protein n=1 Tax=Streptomyces sp. NPDC006551 TaxID=3157178 RepID=UPI0033BEDEDF
MPERYGWVWALPSARGSVPVARAYNRGATSTGDPRWPSGVGRSTSAAARGEQSRSLGAGGPTVDTVLDPGAVQPGGSLGGQVRLQGGGAPATSSSTRSPWNWSRGPRARIGDDESEGMVTFGRFTLGGNFRLSTGERSSVPFGIGLPRETPVTELHGQPLGIELGVRTEVAVAGARDKGHPQCLLQPGHQGEAAGVVGGGDCGAAREAGRAGLWVIFRTAARRRPRPTGRSGRALRARHGPGFSTR